MSNIDTPPGASGTSGRPGSGPSGGTSTGTAGNMAGGRAGPGPQAGTAGGSVPGGNKPGSGPDDISTLRSDLSKLSDTVAGLLRGEGGGTEKLTAAATDAREAFGEAAGSIAKAGSGIAEDTSRHLRTLGGELEDTFHKSPMMSVLSAAALGYLVGMMSRR